MGTTEKDFLCQTCNGTMFDCVGHFGHIELCKPMFHVGYISKIKKLLECVCFYCSRIRDIRALKNKTNKQNTALDYAWSILKTKMLCASENEKGERIGCCNRQPTIKKEGLSLIAMMKGNDEEGKIVLNGEKVYNIFRKINEGELGHLGFSRESRPENMLVTVLLVAPPCMRPSILTDGLRAEDDLTHKYADIVKSNGCLKKYEHEGAPGHIIRDYEQLLQFHLATLINNEMSGQPMATQKSGRPIKSISARLKGKEGRVRGNLMGKRVDFSARTVITPDSSIDLDQVGVPVEVAMIHTFPEKVNSTNIHQLQKMVNNGPNAYPGANYVVRSDGQRIDLKFNRFDLRVERGFVVERHMVDNDVVLFNRQPSLHKMSMMGHRAKVMGNKTFRLNLSVTTPYNADFDGDEMNLHMPQSYNSRSELENLAAVHQNIISPQSNKPVIGIVQDTLVGVWLITLKSVFFNRREAFSLLYAVEVAPERLTRLIRNPSIRSGGHSFWTGIQLFSAILPETASFEGSGVKIENGLLIKGVLNKKVCGATAGGLIHVICNDLSSRAAAVFINNVQRLIKHFMFHISSFSIGVGDTIVDGEMLHECDETIKQAVSKVDALIGDAKNGLLEKLPGMDIGSTFESKVNLILNRARDYEGEISLTNNMNAMIQSGSKGSKINIAQMSACVGQQNVDGKRIPFGFEKRTLPHYQKFDYSAESRGFISNSYLVGMTPQEFFFHAMGGREGLIDTAIKTAETGYLQRRLVKAMEDAVVREDATVRNGLGKIYQFKYGEDGFDAKCLEKIDIEKPTRRSHYVDMFVDREYGIERGEISGEIYEMLRNDMDLQRRLDEEYEYLEKTHLENKDAAGLVSYATPANIRRIIQKNRTRNKGADELDLSPYIVLEEVERICGLTQNKMWTYYAKSILCIKQCILSLTKHEFMQIIKEIEIKFRNAAVSANEMVGTLAAQSVGEPATQMTLNTFHLAGVASTITMGVPRLNEIINTAKTIRTPAMHVRLRRSSLEEARKMRNAIEYVKIKDIYSSARVVYDPDVFRTLVAEDAQLVSDYFEMPDDVNFDQCSQFVMRFEFNRYELVSRGISLDYVISCIERHLKADGLGIQTVTDDKAVVRIRLVLETDESTPFVSDGALSAYQHCIDGLLDLSIQGLAGVKKAHLVETDSSWSLQTDGISFRKILGLPNVDASSTTVNDFYVVYETLGVEAVRETILNELCLVIEGNGSYVNQRHLGLLSDVMTLCGYPAGITRHGVNREVKAGALKRASFEETVDILLEAAASAETNPSHGITENIMMGQLAPLGTGNVELLLDTERLDQMLFSAMNEAKSRATGGLLLNSPAFSEIAAVASNNLRLAEEAAPFSPEHENAESVTFSVPEYFSGMSPASLYAVSPASNAYMSPGSNFSGSAIYSPNSSYVNPGSTFYQSPGSNYYQPASNQNSAYFTPGSSNYFGGSGSYQPGSGLKYNAYSAGSNQNIYSIGSNNSRSKQSEYKLEEENKSKDGE
ncbi:RPB1 [Enterospora canceri]|uniref:DNA-directed RNA polymerase subunit n=1 Tax=Enterospora canceri TaxID=1081671 RepID=A0A1Y1S502_9MICR|nr:RPB1 [Enterospora canceri]